MASPANDQKISEIISGASEQWVSFEFFPPKTEAGVKHLFHAIEALQVYNPKFVDFTWGAGGSTSDLTVNLCERAKSQCGLVTNMHLTCTNMETSKIETALTKCQQAGISNILALRGDPPVGQDKWAATDSGLSCALDLVQHIRAAHGDHFCIGVAGYPEGHPTSMVQVEGGLASLSDSERGRCSVDVDEAGVESIHVCLDASFEGELNYLKAKVDAGASFIVTQMFFDVQVFLSFVNACRSRGITVPILPGIICISNYNGFKKMVKFCKSRVPDELLAQIEAIKDDEAAVKELGFQFGVTTCRQLLAAGVPGLHFYTLNTSALTLRILGELGFPRRIAEPETVFHQAIATATATEGVAPAADSSSASN